MHRISYHYQFHFPLLMLFVFLFAFAKKDLRAQNNSTNDAFQYGLVNGLDTLGLKTGDLLFAQSKTFNGIMTQIGTCSPFTHLAMIYKAEDDSLWLLHATDNNYYGNRMAVKDENEGRSGVILSKLEDIFISTDGGENGFYESLWIIKLKKGIKGPSGEDVLAFYDKYKNRHFETSDLRFSMSALDLYVGGRDLISMKADSLVMCSELITILFEEIGMKMESYQTPNEVTPRDVYRMVEDWYGEAIIYRFADGLYRL